MWLLGGMGLQPGGPGGWGLWGAGGVGGSPAAPRSSHSWAGLPGGGVVAAGAGRQECKHRWGEKKGRCVCCSEAKPEWGCVGPPRLSHPSEHWGQRWWWSWGSL